MAKNVSCEPAGVVRDASMLVWLGRLKGYGLALLFVGSVALLYWALSDVLSLTPLLVFYLALVGAAAFGGLGPGLLATVASWLCIDFLFEPTFGHIGVDDRTSIARLLVFLAGGLAVSVVGERMRRSRIRERRQTEELAGANTALRASEEKYRFLVENSKDVTWMMDLQGTWTFISGNVEKVAGYRVDEILGKTIWDFLAPEYHDLVREKLRQRARGEDLPPYEVLIVGKDGRRIPFELLATAIVDDGGNVVGVQGVSRDITERKRAEEALRESEFHLAQAQQITHLGSWSWDLAEDRLFWSDETYRLYGLQPGESVPRHEDFLGFVHPEDRPRVEQAVQEALAHGGSCQLDFRIVQRGGQERYVHCEARVIFDSDGHPVKAEGALQDITERKRAEETLQASEEKYRFLVENSKDVTYMIDLQGKWVFISSNIERVTGYRADELIGRAILDLLAPECHDLARENIRRRARGEDLPPYEVVAIGKDGRRTPFEVYAGSIIDDGGNLVGVQGVARDITERKRAEQELRESRNKYQALIETTADFIWEMDASGKYTYCSPQMKDLWGYEPQDMIGKTPFDVMPPDDRKQAIESFMSLAKSPQPFTGLEASSYDSQGRLIAIEISGVPFFDADGRLLGYRGISRDVTERKRAQEALAESRKKYRGLVEKVNDWVWEIDADGVYTYVSPRAWELLGYVPEEIVGKTPFDFMPPAEAQRIRNAFELTWLGRKPLEQLENTLVRKDGHLVIVETSGMPVFAEDGTFLGYTGIDRDVTERKQAEEALRESEERYRTLFESSPDGIIFTDMEGRLLRTNSYYQAMLGYSEEELRALSYQQLTPQRWQETEAAIVRDKIMSRGYSGVYEKEYIRKDGTVFPVSIQVWLIRDVHGEPQGMWGIVRDITERKQAEQALRESEEKFRLLAETSPAAILIYQDGKYVYVNPATELITGYQRAELLAQAPEDIVHPDYRRQVKQMISRRARAEGPPMHYELKVCTKDGQERWTDSTTVSVAYGSKPAGLVVAFDVTERKHAEEALRKSEEKFAKAFRSSPIAIAVTRLRDGRILDANEAMLKLLHFTADEVIGHTTRDLDIWVDVNDRVQFTQMLSTASSVRDREYRLRAKDGVIVMIHLSAEVLDVGGEPCLLATLVDVTERRRAAEALRQEKTFTDKLFNAPRDTVFLFEPITGKPIRWNQRFVEVSGYDDEEIAGRKAPDDFYDEQDLKKARDAIVKISTEGQGVVELSLVTKRGVHVPFEYAVTVVETGDGRTLFLSIGRDITERRQAEEALRELNATLESRVALRTVELERRACQLQKLTLELTEAEERERKRLAEILHDDLQQVLAAAKFHMGLLDTRVRNDAKSRAIAGEAKCLLADAIAKSRSLSHELSAPALSQSDLGELFAWLAEQMRTKHGFTVHLEIRERVELPSESLRVLLYRTTQELLFNVVKHAGVREATLRLWHGRGRICLSVSDKGWGFDPQELRQAGGLGLLSIRERIELLGGHMKIRSAQGKGSTFLIVMPDRETAGGGS